MYERILLPLDGSAQAEQALSHAAALAAQFKSELIILRVLPPLQDHGTLRKAGERAEQISAGIAQEYLERVADSVRDQGTPVQVAIAEGRPYFEIVNFAEENSIDLIVMTTRGQSGLSRWLLGSVADRVTRGATVPVLLVQVGGKKVKPIASTPENPKHPIQE
jgi:nucleotide-binding universal stress UspA family protein